MMSIEIKVNDRVVEVIQVSPVGEKHNVPLQGREPIGIGQQSHYMVNDTGITTHIRERGHLILAAKAIQEVLKETGRLDLMKE